MIIFFISVVMTRKGFNCIIAISHIFFFNPFYCLSKKETFREGPHKACSIHIARTSMASVIARRDRMVRMGSSLRECRNSDLVAQLPDKKEWIADHKIEMLMLDG